MAEYIDRNTAIAKVTALEVIEPFSTMVDVKRLLVDMPAADVAQVRHGMWKRYTKNLGECSNCGYVVSIRYKFCPNCGAKMRGSDDE